MPEPLERRVDTVKAKNAPEITATKHYRRLAVVLIGLAAGFMALRGVVVPESFGKEGHYRADAVDEIVARQPRYLGAHTCSECHAGQTKKVSGGAHKQVPCETCHGPARGHLTTSDSRAKLLVDKSGAACLMCHRRVAGRPPSQPQITLAEHQKDNDFNNDACGECHDSHEP